MNAKKAKKLRKITKFVPREPREYETLEHGRIEAKGTRALYQAAKKRIRWE